MTRIQRSRHLPGGLVLALCLQLIGCGADGQSPQADAPVVAARPSVLKVATPHYVVQSTADPAITRDAGAAAEAQAHRVIPLKSLITGQGGPPLDSTVNAHYLGYWSLTHFLLHHDGGRHAAGYRQLLEHGASLQDFERHIGPVAEIERAWYAYLMAQVLAAQAP